MKDNTQKGPILVLISPILLLIGPILLLIGGAWAPPGPFLCCAYAFEYKSILRSLKSYWWWKEIYKERERESLTTTKLFLLSINSNLFLFVNSSQSCKIHGYILFLRGTLWSKLQYTVYLFRIKYWKNY